MQLNSMSIMQKLVVMTFAILLLSGSILLYVIYQIRQSDEFINEVIDEQEQVLVHFKALERVEDLFDDFYNSSVYMALTRFRDVEQKTIQLKSELLGALGQLSEADRKLAATVGPKVELIFKNMQLVKDEYATGNRTQGNKHFIQATEVSSEIDGIIDDGLEDVHLQLQEISDRLVSNNSVLLKTALAGLILSLLVGGVLAVFMSGSITKPIGADPSVVRDMATEISEGNLNFRTHQQTDGAPTGVFAAVMQMKNKLTEVIAVLQDVSSQVRRGAAEILQANMSLNKRAEEQAGNLERTAASMEEMTATVKQNAKNSREADDLVKEARTEAERGGLVVKDAVGAMVEITTSSTRIADIISVIDEIAFQTNLLALNASVEAARAGEQGRGFAVVASEVRALAGRSASAAKEIKELIEDSVGKVQGGSRLVNETGQALEKIVASVSKVSSIVGDISAASQEQASGIEQVNHAVMRMEDMTQQNAALVEEITAACMSLGDKAAALDKSISFFRISDSGRAGSSAPAPSLAPTPSAGGGGGFPMPNPTANTGQMAQVAPPQPAPSFNTESSAAKDMWEEF